MQILSDPEHPQDNSANNSGVIEGLFVDPAISILLIRVVLPILSSLFCPTLLGFFCNSCASSDFLLTLADELKALVQCLLEDGLVGVTKQSQLKNACSLVFT